MFRRRKEKRKSRQLESLHMSLMKKNKKKKVRQFINIFIAPLANYLAKSSKHDSVIPQANYAIIIIIILNNIILAVHVGPVNASCKISIYSQS